VLYWNAIHHWASFHFQLARQAQVPGWTSRFLLEFLGQQFGLIGALTLPLALYSTVMLAKRGYQTGNPTFILFSTAVLFPLGVLLWHGLSSRIGDSWSLFIWPAAFVCILIHLADRKIFSPGSLFARYAPGVIVLSIGSGIALVLTAQLYYVWGTANDLKQNDPVGKEAGFAEIVAAANKARNAVGAKWFATTDYRTYSMLRWSLRDQVPVIQINERSRFIGFVNPVLDGPIGLYVRSVNDPNASILEKTNVSLQTVDTTNLIWRGVSYDKYLFQEMTNWKPSSSLLATDLFESARPH
jgi:hypothetical protein